MGVRESRIEQYAKKRLREEISKDAQVYKWGIEGLPDRVILILGSIFVAEFKTKDGYLSAKQKRRRIQIEKSGVVVWVLDSHEKVDWFVRHLKRFHF